MTTKVIPISYTPDLEKVTRDEGCNAIGIEEMSVTYIQPADTNSHSDQVQTLKVTTRDCCAVGLDDPAGFYFDIEIPDGGHWSVSGGHELQAIINDFKRRLYQETHYSDGKQPVEATQATALHTSDEQQPTE